MQERAFLLSPDDKKTYGRWRKGVVFFYVSVAVLAITTVTALSFLGRAVRYAAQ